MVENIINEERFFRDIFDALADAVVALDKSLSILSMNDRAEALFKVSRKKARGKPASNFLPEETDNIIEKALKEERTIYGDEINPMLRGEDRVAIQAVASPFFSEAGSLLGVIIQIKDLTGAKFLNEKNIQQSSTATLEGLVLGLAHEMKNPLSGIRGAAQILSQAKVDEESAKCAEIIIKEADRLLALLQTLKRLEPFAKEIFEPVDINEVLLEIIFLESRGHKNIEFTHNFDVTLPPVHGDRNSLKQVFLNLIKNASEAISASGSVGVSTKWITDYKLKNESAISVDVKDNGKGIERESMGRIFDPFYSTKKQGEGLGLFLAYQIIAKHGGAIFVESEPGKGAVFKVYLPINK